MDHKEILGVIGTGVICLATGMLACVGYSKLKRVLQNYPDIKSLRAEMEDRKTEIFTYMNKDNETNRQDREEFWQAHNRNVDTLQKLREEVHALQVTQERNQEKDREKDKERPLAATATREVQRMNLGSED